MTATGIGQSLKAMEGDLILSLLTEIKDKLELFLTLTDTGSLSWTVLGQILNLINIETIILYKPPPPLLPC